MTAAAKASRQPLEPEVFDLSSGWMHWERCCSGR